MSRFFFLFFAFLPAVSFAGVEWRGYYGQTYTYGITPEDVCSKKAAELGRTWAVEDVVFPLTVGSAFTPNGWCRFYRDGVYTSQAQLSYRVTCAADEVFNQDTMQCEKKDCEPGLEMETKVQTGWSAIWDIRNPQWIGESVYPRSVCVGGCVYGGAALSGGGCFLVGISPTEKGTAPFNVSCYFNLVSTGAKCTGSESSLTMPPVPCPSGTQLGEVNGVSGCYPVSTTTTDVVQNPDGSTTTTITTDNPDGSTTTTVNNENPDGSGGSTTVTGGGSGGGSGGSGDGSGGSGAPAGTGPGGEVTPEDSFCSQHPNEPSCSGKGGNFGGGNPDPKELYDGGSEKRTFQDSLEDFRDSVQDAELYNSVGNFFTVSAGGSCPRWVLNIPFLNASIPFDFLCYDALINAMRIAGAVILIGFAWVAFRIAVL